MTAMLSPPRRDAILLALSRFRRNVRADGSRPSRGSPGSALYAQTPAVVCSPTVGPYATQAQGAPRTLLGVSGVFPWAE